MIERYIIHTMECVQELYDALTLECDRASAAQLGTIKEYQKMHRKIQSYHRAVHLRARP